MAQHSYSGIKSYEGCPRRYQAEKILKLYPREETEATIYGTLLHEQCELFIKEGKPLDKAFKFLQPTLDALVAMPGRKFPEHEMALKASLVPCDFKDPEYWVRGIADLVIVNDDNMTARIIDYKSGGNKYPDTDQLMLMSLMVFKHFPRIKRCTSKLLFVLKGTTSAHSVDRDDEAKLWWAWRERVAKLDASIYHDVWNPKQSGLCRKYCPVLHCEHCGRR